MRYPRIIKDIAQRTGKTREECLAFWKSRTEFQKEDLLDYFHGIRNDRCEQLVKDVKKRWSKK